MGTKGDLIVKLRLSIPLNELNISFNMACRITRFSVKFGP